MELILQDVNELADGRTHRVLVEDLEWSHPELKERFTAWPSSADRALWAYLDARLLFDEAAKFARAEAYRGGQFSNRWNSLPKDPLGVTPSLTEALEHGVRDYYREKELRADHCRVHHYRRGNGADYFYAYIPEWADKRLGFDANGELTPRELNYAFHNVFIFEPKDGSLEIIAKGGKKVQMPLRRTFCQSILNLVVIYLPWHMNAAAAALADADYTIPSMVLIDKKNHLERKANQGLFHGAWSFRREAFEKVCGYPFIQSGQDQGLLKRFKAVNLRRADPIHFDARPSYVYRWFTAHSQHLSAMGAHGYERFGKQPAPSNSTITPGWDRDWIRLELESRATPHSPKS